MSQLDTPAAVHVVPVETPSLGDRSYLVHDGSVALVVDPQRDIDRVLAVAEQVAVRIQHVVETHIHNDYVTGGLALARATGATYHVNAEDPVTFDRHPVRDGDVVDVGARMRLRAVATPGHTYTHLSYVLEVDGTAYAVFTGGSLLFGSTGRPDLLGSDHTDTLVHLQYRSAQRLGELPEGTHVFPTHGFGSFCSATQSDATASTIGRERQTNPALTASEEAYVRDLLDGLDAFPAYYAHMAPANAAGPDAPDLSPPRRADVVELRRRIEAGEWVVDLRNRRAFAAGHVRGTLNFGLDGSFSTYLGWMIGWGTPLTLLADTAEEVAIAQRDLARIGIERPEAAATGGPAAWTTDPLGSFPVATFADLADVRHHRPVAVLDVRRAQEHDEERIEGAVNIPIHELVERLDEVPDGEVWVHCAAGYRASVAASVLAAAGRTTVAVDDDFDERPDGGAAAGGRGPPGRNARLMLVVAVLAGLAIGLSLGALGGGGSILAVPVLVYLLGQSPVAATTGSLLIVGISAATGAVAAHRRGTVYVGRGLAFALVATVGAAVGATWSVAVSPQVLLGAFSVLMLVVAVLMLVRQTRHVRRPGITLDEPIVTVSPTFMCNCPRAAKVVVTALAVGLLTGFLGVGGGFLVVPALVLALGLAMPTAVGTSLLVIAVTSSVALVVRLGHGVSLDWTAVLLLTAAAVVGSLLGTRVAARVDPRRLGTAFAVLLMVVALYTAARTFGPLLV